MTVINYSMAKAISFAGSKAELARMLGITPQRIHNWVKRGSVPPRFAKEIEAVTKGTVKKENLNPIFK